MNITTSDQRRIWTRKEIAEFLSVSERTVDKLREAGKLPCKYLGRNVRFDRDDVLALLRSPK
jgi:excisionase family DNA binding protein